MTSMKIYADDVGAGLYILTAVLDSIVLWVGITKEEAVFLWPYLIFQVSLFLVNASGSECDCRCAECALLPCCRDLPTELG